MYVWTTLLEMAKCVPINRFLHFNLSRPICHKLGGSGAWCQASLMYTEVSNTSTHNNANMLIDWVLLKITLYWADARKFFIFFFKCRGLKPEKNTFFFTLQCSIQIMVILWFSGDNLIGCTTRSKWGPFCDLLKEELIPRRLYGCNLPPHRNQQIDLKIFLNCLNNGTYGNTT